MPAWLLPAITTAVDIGLGLAGAAGQAQTNKANLRIAREQMAFQERMSSTSAQRAVKDYEAAGLNPGLAYDRGASSPGGASTTLGDPISAGISSAQRAREARQALRIAREQHEANLNLTRAQADKARAETATSMEQGTYLRSQYVAQNQRTAFDALAQPAELRLRNAQAVLQELLVPGARNSAQFEERLNSLGTGAGSQALRALLETIKTLRGR